MNSKVKSGIAIALTIMTLFSIAVYIHYDNPDGKRNGKELAEVTFVTNSSGLTIYCEVADTPDERERGLMNRDNLAQDRGMLFVFEPSRNVTFWMKNTTIPLDIIFVTENSTVADVARADPEPGVSDDELTRYKSDGPAKWVVEINQGLAGENGVGPGIKVEIELPD